MLIFCFVLVVYEKSDYCSFELISDVQIYMP